MRFLSKLFKRREPGSLRVFHTICEEVFRDRMTRYGFSFSRERSHAAIETHYFRNSQLYIEIMADEDIRDSSEQIGWSKHCRIALGEGSDKWPETDWNRIGLWQLARASGIEGGDILTDTYPYKDIPGLREALLLMRADLERYAHDFLNGNTTLLRSIRAENTRTRTPHRIGRPGPSGRYEWEEEPESRELKRHYSEDNPDEDHAPN